MGIFIDGKINHIQPESSQFSINGSKIYSYDKKSGVLELALQPSVLEEITANIDIFPDKSTSIRLQGPFLDAYLLDVKKILGLPISDASKWYDVSLPIIVDDGLGKPGFFYNLMTYLKSKQKQI